MKIHPRQLGNHEIAVEMAHLKHYFESDRKTPNPELYFSNLDRYQLLDQEFKYRYEALRGFPANEWRSPLSWKTAERSWQYHNYHLRIFQETLRSLKN